MKYYEKSRFMISIGLLVLISIFSLLFFDMLNLLNTAMLFMVPILFSALHNERKEVLFISLLSVLSFDVLFIPPRFSLTVADANYLISFIIMVVTGQMVSSLAKQAAIAKELEISEKIQDALLESLSHELRTPLAVIKGCSSGLLEQNLILSDKERIQLIETIDENAEDMEQLIHNLINSAKLKNGILHLKKDICDLEDIIGSALLKTEKEQTANFVISQNIPTIYANAIFIEQALINLLDNAFKYGFDVVVTVTEKPHGVLIIVSNQGTIPSVNELCEAIKPFVRLSNASSKRGLGLGLHVVQLIAEIHRGTLTLKSDNERFFAELFLPKRAE
ncbi:MAG: DUF4118 domain-containing protein [Sulfurimonas sp.]|uniref:sensor histidine kinase n=1 Tax=Sulfurimonas sp. TaxID=2022749 RepID=UPI00261A7347|nr:DUF4118 domain-containing protein [Sulfurimonas sp.]MDD5372679.1 DUF4118 domain-containing protein [Sulfurimonas sp.]